MTSPDSPVTQLLAEWRAGSDQALSQLSALLYDELRQLAQRALRGERQDHTIQRTALVNEAFMRLVAQNNVDWQNRAQFFALASSLMRRILVDYARARNAQKRGGGVDVFSLDGMVAQPNDDGHLQDHLTPTALHHHDGELHDDVIAIDRALAALDTIDPQQSRVVEMRYFAGLTVEETAEALGISPATVKREWAMARAWLRCAVERDQ